MSEQGKSCSLLKKNSFDYNPNVCNLITIGQVTWNTENNVQIDKKDGK